MSEITIRVDAQGRHWLRRNGKVVFLSPLVVQILTKQAPEEHIYTCQKDSGELWDIAESELERAPTN